MNRKIIFKSSILIFLVAVMILPAGIKDAWAYFTTYARAEGGYFVSFGYDTQIEETVSDWTKNIIIKNKEGSQPVYVRVKAFCGDKYSLTYSGSKWSLGGDGFWYYKDAINGGSQTLPLHVKIGNIPEEVKDFTELNVVVVYECTPVRYDGTGKPYADWTEGRR